MAKFILSTLVLASALTLGVPAFAQNMNNTAAGYAQQDKAQALWSQRVRSQSTSNQE